MVTWWIKVTNTHSHSHAHAHAHTQPFYGSLDFVWDNLGDQVPEETFTHSHMSWSSIVPYLLHPSNMTDGFLPVQSMCPTVFFHNLCPSFLWSTSWPGTLHFKLHTFLHPTIVFFLQHMPIQRFFWYRLTWVVPDEIQRAVKWLCVCVCAHTIATNFAVVPRLCHLNLVSLSKLYMEFYLVASCHISIWPFSSLPAQCHLIFLSYWPGATFSKLPKIFPKLFLSFS